MISPGEVADMVDGLWYEAPGGDDALIMRYSRPTDYMPDYGEKIQGRFYEALTHVMVDDGDPMTNDVKRKAVINLVQIGLDRYALALADPAVFDSQCDHYQVQNRAGHFSGSAGHGEGAKFSIYFAGWMLDDADMMQLALPAQHQGERAWTQPWFMGWTEDDQVFIVSPTGPDEWNYGACGYGPPGNTGEDIAEGTPEWGQTHFERVRLGAMGPEIQDDPHWLSTQPLLCPVLGSSTPYVAYRTCCTASVWWMGNLFSRLIRQQVIDSQATHLPDEYLYRPEFYHYANRYHTLMTGEYAWFVAIQGNEDTLFHLPLFGLLWNAYDGIYEIPALPGATLPPPRCP